MVRAAAAVAVAVAAAAGVAAILLSVVCRLLHPMFISYVSWTHVTDPRRNWPAQKAQQSKHGEKAKNKKTIGEKINNNISNNERQHNDENRAKSRLKATLTYLHAPALIEHIRQQQQPQQQQQKAKAARHKNL